MPQAAIPPAKVPVPGTDPTSFTTAEVGITPVKVLWIRSRLTEREDKPLGVTMLEQQEISCSSGENVYTLTQMFPTEEPKPGPSKGAPFRPVLVTLRHVGAPLGASAEEMLGRSLTVPIRATVRVVDIALPLD